MRLDLAAVSARRSRQASSRSSISDTEGADFAQPLGDPRLDHRSTLFAQGLDGLEVLLDRRMVLDGLVDLVRHGLHLGTRLDSLLRQD